MKQTFFILTLCSFLTGSGSFVSADEPSCPDADPLRNVFFGDLHVHTSLSLDAWMWGNRVAPEGALQYAIDTGLDFSVISDHSEWLGELQLCTTIGSPAYNTAPCVRYRDGDRSDFSPQNQLEEPQRNVDVCDIDGSRCREWASDAWARLVAAVDDANTPANRCTFSAFPGYEWTGSNGGTNQHRTVIFRSADVPDLPVSHFEAPFPHQMREALVDVCLESVPGCDVIAIPHNSNFGLGTMFMTDIPGVATLEDQVAAAWLRQRLEPVVEIFQHKGSSVCQPDAEIFAQPDPLCRLEIYGPGERGAYEEDYAYTALGSGLKEWLRLGVNPFQFGFVGATDTHGSTPGHVDETDYRGHVATMDDEAIERLRTTPHDWAGYNPGGLTAVWATENTPDALFDAIRRREVYATSGPKIAVRTFASWDNLEGLCDHPDLVGIADEIGVPMGGELEPRPWDPTRQPEVIATARADETPLAQIQIVKTWIDPVTGFAREEVHTIAGDAQTTATVDLETCQRSGTGYSRLCGTWVDVDFDTKVPAAYHVRVVEVPTCRWSRRQCNELASSVAARLSACADPSANDINEIIQEQAWTSPIWYPEQSVDRSPRRPAGRVGY